ncbi:MAG TPA: FHA domain-containing protein [Actinomycetota bacterium]
MPPIVLTTLKWLFLALLYLFIARSVRIIYLDLVGPRVPRQRQAGAGGRPRRRGTPRSVIVAEPEKPSRHLALDNEVTFGRSESCTVPLDDTYTSTLHARLFAKEGAWFVEDMGSTNGTYLNRVKVTAPAPIAVGDEIRLGKTILEIGK